MRPWIYKKVDFNKMRFAVIPPGRDYGEFHVITSRSRLCHKLSGISGAKMPKQQNNGNNNTAWAKYDLHDGITNQCNNPHTGYYSPAQNQKPLLNYQFLVIF
jgi:hypothetical protein